MNRANQQLTQMNIITSTGNTYTSMQNTKTKDDVNVVSFYLKRRYSESSQAQG